MELTEHKFNYDWTLKSANFTRDKGKVFSCFACGCRSNVFEGVVIHLTDFRY